MVMMEVEPTPDQQEALAQLEKVEALIDLESMLTDALEKAEPLLLNKTASATGKARVRPIPSNLDEAQQILAVARGLSGRTSAPAGWNPNLPVVGFATPNPLPHQLRNGSLGSLQLERARQAQERTKKRLRQEEQEASRKQKQLAADKQEDDATRRNSDVAAGGELPLDPKRREIVDHDKELDRTSSDIARTIRTNDKPRKGPPQPVLATTMNLSDSSSSEDESD